MRRGESEVTKACDEFHINCGHILLALKEISGKLLAPDSNDYFITRIEFSWSCRILRRVVYDQQTNHKEIPKSAL